MDTLEGAEGPTAMETPDWLKKDEENQSSKDCLEPSLATMETTSNDAIPEKPSSASSAPRCGCAFTFLISAVLLALFVYSAITQKNDSDNLAWYIFYGMHAGIPALFLCHYLICFPAGLIYFLTLGMTVWSTVGIVLMSIKLSDTPKGGEEKGTGDEDDQTLHEEYVWELVGVSVGLFSALYHSFMMKCCVSKGKKSE